MNKYNNKTMCTSTVNKLYDHKKTLTEINSNFSIKFNLSNNCSLPCNSKIDILETKLDYSVCRVDGDILVNGHNLQSKLSNLNYSFTFKENYTNLIENSCKKILLNITECMKLNIFIKIELKAVAHTDDCEDIYIEAIGECEDCIETLLMTSIFIPNRKCVLDKLCINLDNSLIAIVNPDYIFLSPIYDSSSNIDGFLGNVFINYGLMLNVSSCIQCKTQ